MLNQRPFTPKELAKRWQCSEKHVRNLVLRGALESFRIGKMIRVTPEAVEDYECGSKSSEANIAPSGPKTARPAASRFGRTIINLPGNGLRT